jgi:glycosyltransferase involved in cell wall biosynthesis
MVSGEWCAEPDISFLIPVYNMADTLPEILECFIRIHEFPFEIIVINDGSSDSIDQVLDEWNGRFLAMPNVCFQSTNQENRGRAYALNEGAKIASGQYLSFVDADDLIDPAELFRIWDCMKSAGAKLVIGQFKIMTGFGKRMKRRSLKRSMTSDTLIRKLAYSPISPIHLNAFLIKRSYFLELKGLDMTNLKSEDKDLIIRLLNCTDSIQICDSYHYIYRKHNLPRVQLMKKRVEWFTYRQKMIRKNFSGVRKVVSMTFQAFFDLAKLFYEGLFKYGY